MTLPNRPRAHELESLSKAKACEIFASAGWAVEQLANDYGDDLLVRIFDNRQATPYWFFVQLKASEDFERLLVADGQFISCPISSKNAKAWEQAFLPVFLLVWCPKTPDSFHWEYVQEYLERTGQNFQQKKTIRIRVPFSQRLDKSSVNTLRTITKARHEQYERHKDGARHLVEFIAHHWGAKIEFDPEAGLALIPVGSFQPAKEGGDHVLAFGELAELIQSVEATRGIPMDQIIEHRLILLWKLAQAYHAGGDSAVATPQDGIDPDEWQATRELFLELQQHRPPRGSQPE